MTTVYFNSVGRNKKSWQSTTKEITYDFLLKEVKRNAGIMSSYPDFELDDDKQVGTVVCGMRICGEFSWKIIEKNE